MGVLDDRLEIFTAPGRLIALVAGAVALIGASLFVALGFGDAPQGSFLRFVGWLGVVFFGGCLLLILRQLLFLRGPVVVMDRQGLLDRRLARSCAVASDHRSGTLADEWPAGHRIDRSAENRSCHRPVSYCEDEPRDECKAWCRWVMRRRDRADDPSRGTAFADPRPCRRCA